MMYGVILGMKFKISQINKLSNMKKIIFFVSLSFLILFSGCSKDNKELSKPEQICKDAGDDPSQFDFESNAVGFTEQIVTKLDDINRYPDDRIYIFSAYRKGTEDLFFWICKYPDYSLITKGKLNIPHTITEDQGYGNVVNLQFDRIYFRYFGKLYDTSIIEIQSGYFEEKNYHGKLIFINGGKYYISQKEIRYPDPIEWYNGSILSNSSSYYVICLSQTGDVIKDLKNWPGGVGTRFVEWMYHKDEFLYLPIDYLYTFLINKSNPTISYIDIENGIEYRSVLDAIDNNVRVDALKLISNENNIILLECYTTAYSGEKKTYKIKYSLVDNTFEVVQ